MAFKNRYYPHLLPDDIPVWEHYLSLYNNQYDHFDYDVRVGEGREAPPDFPKNLRGMALDLSRRRIDAVGYTADRIDIIEITRLIDLKAVGQVIAYPLLYQRTYSPREPLRTLVVGEKLNTDIEPVLASTDVHVVILTPPHPALLHHGQITET